MSTKIFTQINANIKQIQQAIGDCAKQYQRNLQSIQLVAVSKTHAADKITAAYQAGQTAFGENYVQEALDKIQELQHLPLEWHFIGHIQSNKTQQIAKHFNWVHSVDSVKIAERLSKQRPAHLPLLNVLIEVNIDQEAAKAGVHLNELKNLAQAIKALPQLNLRGLMTIPKPQINFADQRKPYALLKQAFDELNQQGFALDTLSMGMSDDFAAAIAEGATMLRIGTAIFGERK